jgi:DNA-directed RNA polymerase subunit beta'
MMSSNNILSPANGDPIIVPSQDVVLGLYFMTREKVGAKGEGMMFSDTQEVHRAYEGRQIELQAKVKVRVREWSKSPEGVFTEKLRVVHTTVGRSLLCEILPKGLSFDLVNQDMTKKIISATINACYRALGLKRRSSSPTSSCTPASSTPRVRRSRSASTTSSSRNRRPRSSRPPTRT